MTTTRGAVGAESPSWQHLRAGPAGVERWNALSSEERLAAGPFHGLSLNAAELAGVNLGGLDLLSPAWEKTTIDIRGR
jgi:hypothetical protein